LEDKNRVSSTFLLPNSFNKLFAIVKESRESLVEFWKQISEKHILRTRDFEFNPEIIGSCQDILNYFFVFRIFNEEDSSLFLRGIAEMVIIGMLLRNKRKYVMRLAVYPDRKMAI